MMKYRVTLPNGYREFAEELDAQLFATENNTNYEAIEIVLPPKEFVSITPIQLRSSLVMSGISLELIETIINSLPEPDKTIAFVKWEYAKEYERDDALVNGLGAAIGLTIEQIDAIWELGATL